MTNKSRPNLGKRLTYPKRKLNKRQTTYLLKLTKTGENGSTNGGPPVLLAIINLNGDTVTKQQQLANKGGWLAAVEDGLSACCSQTAAILASFIFGHPGCSQSRNRWDEPTTLERHLSQQSALQKSAKPAVLTNPAFQKPCVLCSASAPW